MSAEWVLLVSGHCCLDASEGQGQARHAPVLPHFARLHHVAPGVRGSKQRCGTCESTRAVSATLPAQCGGVQRRNHAPSEIGSSRGATALARLSSWRGRAERAASATSLLPQHGIKGPHPTRDSHVHQAPGLLRACPRSSCGDAIVAVVPVVAACGACCRTLALRPGFGSALLGRHGSRAALASRNNRERFVGGPRSGSSTVASALPSARPAQPCRWWSSA